MRKSLRELQLDPEEINEKEKRLPSIALTVNKNIHNPSKPQSTVRKIRIIRSHKRVKTASREH